YDVLGRAVSVTEARELLATGAGARELSPAVGAVAITERLVADGRAAFYEETFGNELFLTDVLGILDGGISPWSIARASIGLGGRGTHDLRVRLRSDVQDRKSTRLNSSHVKISYAVFCLKKKK